MASKQKMLAMEFFFVGNRWRSGDFIPLFAIFFELTNFAEKFKTLDKMKKCENIYMDKYDKKYAKNACNTR